MTRRTLFPLGTALLAAATVFGLTVAPSSAEQEPLAPVLAPPETETEVEPAPAQPTALDLDPLPPLPQNGLRTGDEGETVKAMERLLFDLHFDPGPLDGVFDQATEFAVKAFEKLAGMGGTGVVDSLVWSALQDPPEVEARLPDGGSRRVEVDLPNQLLFLYQDDDLRLISHVSSGSGQVYCVEGDCQVADTPAGAHRFMWRVDGWRKSRLGRLFNPVYFTGDGIAIHGFPSVPDDPASHGCVRVPMHVGEYFPSLVENGDPIYVFDGETKVEPLAPDDPGDGARRGWTPPDFDFGPAESPEAAEAGEGAGSERSREGWLDGEAPPDSSTSTTTTPVPSLLS